MGDEKFSCFGPAAGTATLAELVCRPAAVFSRPAAVFSRPTACGLGPRGWRPPQGQTLKSVGILFDYNFLSFVLSLSFTMSIVGITYSLLFVL